MDKLKSQLDKVFEEIVRNNFGQALKQLKKIQEKSEKEQIATEQLIRLHLFKSYSNMKLANYGQSKQSIEKVLSEFRKVKSTFVFENSRMIMSVLKSLNMMTELVGFLDNIQAENHEIETEFLKMNLENKLVAKDFNSASSILMKMSKESGRKKQLVFSSFYLKVFDVLMDSKKHELYSYVDYYLFDIKLSEEDLKKLEFVLKCAGMVLTQEKDLQTPTILNFTTYIDLVVSFHRNQLDVVCSNLSKREVNFEWFVLCRRLHSKVVSIDHKNQLHRVYFDALFEYLQFTNEESMMKQQPMFEEMLFVIDSWRECCQEFEVNRDWIVKFRELLNDNVSRFGENVKFAFHLKNCLLSLALLSENEEELNRIVNDLVRLFGEHLSFADEIFGLFGSRKPKGKTQSLCVVKEVMECLAKTASKSSIVHQINLAKLEMHLHQQDRKVDNWPRFVKLYFDCFDQKTILSKGERRKEDDWLMLALDLLSQSLSKSFDLSTAYVYNSLALYGYQQSKYNYDLMLHLVMSNQKLGFYVFNSELFSENDLKGSQNETMGYHFNTAFYECFIYSNHQQQTVERYMKNFEMAVTKASKTLTKCTKSCNFSFVEEFYWNLEMNQRSYQKSVVFNLIANRKLNALFRNQKDDQVDYLFFKSKLDNLMQSRFMNLDFVVREGYGVYSNPDYLLVNHLSNSLFYEVFVNGVSNVSKEMVKKVSETISKFGSFNAKEAFVTVRRNDRRDSIEETMNRITQNWLAFHNTTQFKLHVELLSAVVRIVGLPPDDPEFKSALLCLETVSKPDQLMLNLTHYDNLFFVSNALGLSHKVGLLLRNQEKLGLERKRVVELLEDLKKTLLKNMCCVVDQTVVDSALNSSGLVNVVDKKWVADFNRHLVDSFTSFKMFAADEFRGSK